MSAPTNVRISVQSLAENKIQEIAYDGRETFIKPLTISESLTDLANRINFLDVDDNSSPTGATDEEMAPSLQMKQSPWEGIRSHLQRALIEMNVLVDVMAIAQNKPATSKETAPESADTGRYFMYDVAPKEAEQAKQVIQVLTKKKCLSAASKILLNGSDRLSKAWTEASVQINFHSELLKLRRLWRVRRIGDKIIGDLSYRTVGSNFWKQGTFEVIKKSSDNDDDMMEESSLSTNSPFKSPIKVVVNPSLLGHASIFVSIVNTKSCPSLAKHTLEESCSLTYFDLVENSLSSANEPLWQRKLCNAQNVLFCQELFALLTKEAMQYKSFGMVTPFVVVGNTISTNVFNHTKLIVKLVYSRKASKQNNQISSDVDFFCLKHALLQILQSYHSQKLNFSPPHPVPAVIGLNSRIIQASVESCPNRQLQTRYQAETQSLAEALVKMSKHFEVQRRTAQVIDTLSAQFQDPDILAHWSILCNMYESSVRVTISSAGFESCYRSIVHLTAKPNEIKALHKEGKILSLSVDPESIYDYFIALIAEHQLLAIQSLARIAGWTILSISLHSSLGRSSTLRNRGTLTAASSPGDKCVAVVCKVAMDSTLDYEIHVQYPRGSEKPDIQMKGENVFLDNSKYAGLRGDWHQVDWPCLQGRHFIDKVEGLLTILVN